MRKINRIVVHCSAGFGGVDSMRKYWRSLGWKSDGYHIVIDVDGKINYLNTYNKITNGVKGYNSDSIHICYVGGVVKASNGRLVASDTRTPEQKESLLEVLKTLKGCYDVPIVGHRDLSPDLNGDNKITPNEWVKECPSFNAIDEYKHL